MKSSRTSFSLAVVILLFSSVLASAQTPKQRYEAAIQKAEQAFNQRVKDAQAALLRDLAKARKILELQNTRSQSVESVKVKGSESKLMVSMLGDKGWSEVPDVAQRAAIFVPLEDQPKDGVVEFEILNDVKVCIVASWGYDGNSSGGWTEERSTRTDLIEQGWKEVGQMYYRVIDRHTIFMRDCKRGEKFRIRSRKYYRPYVMIPGVMKETPKVPPVAIPDGQVIQVSQSKIVDAAAIVEPQSMPEALRGTAAYVSPMSGVALIKVHRRSLVYLAASWANDGNSNGQWTEEVWDREALLEAGWTKLEDVSIKHRGSYQKHELFMKEVDKGESHRIRTRKYGAPFVFCKTPAATQTENP